MQRMCSGKGECYSMNNQHKFVKNETPCEKSCELRECVNFKICRSFDPERLMSSDMLCKSCSSEGFGKFNQYINDKCKVCGNEGFTIDRPDCVHHICINCFHDCYSVEQIPYIRFPSSDLEKSYLSSMIDSKEFAKIPEMIEREKVVARLRKLARKQYDLMSYMRICNVCLKPERSAELRQLDKKIKLAKTEQI